MKIAKGKSAWLFLGGIPLLVLGAILYFKSEQLGGIENVQRGKNLEVAAIVIFVAGVLCWIGSFLVGGGSKKKTA